MFALRKPRQEVLSELKWFDKYFDPVVFTDLPITWSKSPCQCEVCEPITKMTDSINCNIVPWLLIYRLFVTTYL